MQTPHDIPPTSKTVYYGVVRVVGKLVDVEKVLTLIQDQCASTTTLTQLLISFDAEMANGDIKEDHIEDPFEGWTAYGVIDIDVRCYSSDDQDIITICRVVSTGLINGRVVKRALVEVPQIDYEEQVDSTDGRCTPAQIDQFFNRTFIGGIMNWA